MKQLSKLQNFVFLMGGALMVVGVALNFFGVQQVGACVFLIGAVCFGVMQMLQRYEGQSIVIRRLRRIMIFADVLFIVSGLLLVEQNFNTATPYEYDTENMNKSFLIKCNAKDRYNVLLLCSMKAKSTYDELLVSGRLYERCVPLLRL